MTAIVLLPYQRWWNQMMKPSHSSINWYNYIIDNQVVRSQSSPFSWICLGTSAHSMPASCFNNRDLGSPTHVTCHSRESLITVQEVGKETSANKAVQGDARSIWKQLKSIEATLRLFETSRPLRPLTQSLDSWTTRCKLPGASKL